LILNRRIAAFAVPQKALAGLASRPCARRRGFSFCVSDLRFQQQEEPEVAPAGPPAAIRYAGMMESPAADRATLVLFCRRPAPGSGKQRVAATVGAGAALALAERLLATALEDAMGWPGPVALAPAAAADAGWASGLLGREARVVPQPEGTLGARLAAVDRELRAAGHARLLFIGSDAPLLDCAYYARARLALDHADVVLGPAEDGGVTLMGARVPWPDLDDLPWSGADLGDALDRRCRARGLQVQRLAPRYDVDAADQLPRLARDLGGDPRPARVELRRWLLASGLAGVVTP
jgi:hypothetical protein